MKLQANHIRVPYTALNSLTKDSCSSNLINVHPCVARRTPWRDKSTIWTSKASPSQAYKIRVYQGLFYGYYSCRTLVCNENYRGVGYTVACSIDAINCRFICSPLLNHDQLCIFGFRSHSINVLSRKNIAKLYKRNILRVSL